MKVEVLGIRIQRFRKIRDVLELDFEAPRGGASKMIVLAGPNGSGKTTVLDALLLGLGQQNLIVRDLEKSEREEHWRVSLPADARIEISLEMDGSRLKVVRTADEHFVEDGGNKKSLPGALQSMAIEYFSSWRAPTLVGSIRPMSGPGARARDTESNRLWRLKQRINDERSKAAYGRAAESKADGWLEKINEAWARLHGNDGTRIDADIVEQGEDVLADLFVKRGDARVCSIDQVSAGEIELLCIAGWIVLNDFDAGLLLIDEPELHLHAQWQTAILPAIRALAPKAQLIVASHSDAIWRQAYGFERFLLVEPGDPRATRPLPAIGEAKA